MPRRGVGHWNHPATRAAHGGRRHDAAAVCDSDGNYHVVRLPSLDEFVPRTQSNRQQYHSEGDQENARPAQSRNGFPENQLRKKGLEHHTGCRDGNGKAQVRNPGQV